MTSAIVETLAKEFSVKNEHAERVFELLGRGSKVPYIARYRRAEIGSFNDGTLRRFARRLKQLEELERRRASLLRSLEEQSKRVDAGKGGAGAKTPAADAASSPNVADEDAETGDKAAKPADEGVEPADEGAKPADEGAKSADEGAKSADEGAKSEDEGAKGMSAAAAAKTKGKGRAKDPLRALRTCMDRFELEDLFQPHRRPEPEVQLALDRGLGYLADLLVEPLPAGATGAGEEEGKGEQEGEASTGAAQASAEGQDASASAEGEASPKASAPPSGETEEDPGGGESTTEEAPTEEAQAGEAQAGEAQAGEAQAGEAQAGEAQAGEAPAEAQAGEGLAKEGKRKRGKKEPPRPLPLTKLQVSPDLARVCQPFINTDRGIHSDMQALEGAIRILADRLGRNPELRSLLRRMLRRHGRLTVRPLVEEAKLGRNRSLLKVNTPLRQLQGHRLLALRQAHSQRLLATSIHIDEALVMPKVRAALGKRLRPEFQNVAQVVSEQALRQRLLPMIEDDVRNDLRERADEEAIRFLAQHLRQVLLAPAAGPRPVAGVHVDAKGDWCLVVLDGGGDPVGSEIKIEASTLKSGELAERLGEELRASRTRALVIGHGKGSRKAVHQLRESIQVISADASVFLVNDAGVASYANSELARNELADYSVPAREAISLGRRCQDPMNELLKVEPRHLGLGREQSVISKANLRRVLTDTIESCVSHVGCDLNTAPLNFLRHVPGLNFELARKLVERRKERPFMSREELRTEGLLEDSVWTNSIGFLRVTESNEPLDRTALHPEQYDLTRRVVLQTGGSVEETLGRREAAKGLKRADFDVDEATWRDLVREISFPGRDPRQRLFMPTLLPFDTEPKSLDKGRVVEGIISNVASFGAFVDLGIPRDGMIHISEISERYVRDARALLSVGQIVRARVLDADGPRIELSLKKVPDTRGGRGRGGAHRRSEKGRRKGGSSGERSGSPWPEYKPVMRAAHSRRDGLAGAGAAKERGGGGRGGGRGGGAGKGRGGPGGRRRGQADEQYDAEAIRKVNDPSESAYNPFATFFAKDPDKQEDAGAASEANE